jgi:membrane-bound lytic murein transglycosylase B
VPASLRLPLPSPSTVVLAALLIAFVASTVAANRLAADRLALAAAGDAAPLPAASPLAAGDRDLTERAITSAEPASLSTPPLREPAPEAEPEPEPEPDPDPAPEPPSEPEPGPVGLLPRIDPEQLQRVAASANIPVRALEAYAGAALRIAQEQPGCNLSWSTLAAIGRVESIHGTLGGGHIQADGWPSEPIVGVPLNGGPGVRAIRDTDGGKWDGDSTWDRAVGPMQFIPSTWRRWAVDANGDGVAHPQHIDDSSLAAARYLCASGRDLRDGRAWTDAILSYNRSESYVRTVHGWANRYATASHG